MMKKISSRTVLTESEDETLALGALLAEFLSPGMTVLLEGELGAGKTTLVRGYCAALGCKNVRSPSFTLMNIYNGRNSRQIIHSDLYRLDRCDVDELELEEYAEDGAVLFVEWADRGFKATSSSLTLRLSYGEQEDGCIPRIVEFSAGGERGERMLEKLFNAIEEGGVK